MKGKWNLTKYFIILSLFILTGCQSKMTDSKIEPTIVTEEKSSLQTPESNELTEPSNDKNSNNNLNSNTDSNSSANQNEENEISSDIITSTDENTTSNVHNNTDNKNNTSSNTTETSKDSGTSMNNTESKNNSASKNKTKTSTLDYYGQLHVNGTNLCDENNNPIQLKGLSSHGLGWFPEYINMDAFKSFKNDWNMNVLRLAMYTEEYNGYCSSNEAQKKNLKSIVNKGIEIAQDLDLYVIVDWHILSDGNPLTHVKDAIEFFDEISSKYKNDPHILYEICNEPNGSTTWADIKSYAKQVIPVIRKNAPDAIIIVGTPTWSQDVDIAAQSPITEYDNIMYALHFYADTHRDNLRNKMVSAIESGLPVFVSEYGICDASGNGLINTEEANKWVALMDQHKVSYIAWNLSNKSESSAIIKSSCKKTSGFLDEDLSDSGKWLKSMLSGTDNLDSNANQDYNSSDNTTANKNTSSIKVTPTPSDIPKNNSSTSTTESADIDDFIKKITVSYSIQPSILLDTSWEESGSKCYLYRITLKNITSKPIENWTLKLEFQSNAEIKDNWNCTAKMKQNKITITPVDYNQTIQANSSISDLGIIVKVKSN